MFFSMTRQISSKNCFLSQHDWIKIVKQTAVTNTEQLIFSAECTIVVVIVWNRLLTH